MGSEDFSFYLEKVKGSFAFLGTGSDDSVPGGMVSLVHQVCAHEFIVQIVMFPA